ncbi:MAG: cupin domain-containing protein [Acidobacteriota bacterium]
MPIEMIQHCEDLDAAIAEHIARGYRLDMIVPADSPTAAQLSFEGKLVRLVQPATDVQRLAIGDTWIKGRAGMEYRDLVPDRIGGRLIASNIRLTKGGDVPDYVHYHKVRFQMIYCIAGAIKVVYEGQGPPFWLMPGDCVLQPPEIRHRVIEAQTGSEVVELGVPAIHETWVEHDIPLPTDTLDTDRDFGGQRFVRHIAADAVWEGSEFGKCKYRDTGIALATSGLADVRVLRLDNANSCPITGESACGYVFLYMLGGAADAEAGSETTTLGPGTAIVVPSHLSVNVSAEAASILIVTLNNI